MASPIRARAVWMLDRLTGSNDLSSGNREVAQMKKPPAAFAGGGLGSAGSAKSGSSGSFSRAHVVGANSNGGNGNSAAKAGVTVRVGAVAMHDVVGSRPEGNRWSQGIGLASVNQFVSTALSGKTFFAPKASPSYSPPSNKAIVTQVTIGPTPLPGEAI